MASKILSFHQTDNSQSVPVFEDALANFLPKEDDLKIVGKQEWLNNDDFEGQLSVDVFQDESSLIIKAPIAGVNPEDLEIAIENDMLTIRGKRENESEISDKDFFYKECFWGSFSRSILLPIEVRSEAIKAVLKNGILTIILPKISKNNKIDILVED